MRMLGMLPGYSPGWAIIGIPPSTSCRLHGSACGHYRALLAARQVQRCNMMLAPRRSAAAAAAAAGRVVPGTNRPVVPGGLACDYARLPGCRCRRCCWWSNPCGPVVPVKVGDPPCAQSAPLVFRQGAAPGLGSTWRRVRARNTQPKIDNPVISLGQKLSTNPVKSLRGG